MFHHVGFGKWNDGAGLQGDDVDVHVVAQIGGFDKARGCPFALGSGHGDGLYFLIGRDKSGWRVESFDLFVSLAYPMEAGGFGAGAAQGPFGCRRDIGIATGGQGVGGCGQRQ